MSCGRRSRCWGAILIWLCAASAFGAGPFDESIVRVSVTKRGPNVLQPWTKASPTNVAGTGFVIDGQRLLTNAHVVEYASQIYVQPNKSSETIEATVAAWAPEVDLALLSVADSSFFANRPPIPMPNELPKTKSPVNVYGYPIGGDQISVTEGIISRIDFTQLPLGVPVLRIQIDAALNPGNSGGPAISDGKLVGVAFQIMQKAENIGYLISVDEVAMFLEDLRDGQYDGKSMLLGEMQTVENEALRSRLGLAKEIGGVVVTRLSRLAMDSSLKVGDVITHIGDHALDQAARVRVSDDLGLPFTYFVPKLARDNKLQLRVWRDGQSLDIEVPVVSRVPQVIPPLRGAYPRYFILGPLVFSAASREFLSGVGSQMGAVLLARGSPFFTRMMDEPQFADEEFVVIAAPMFSHKLTKGYNQPLACIVAAINGNRVRNLQHLVELLRDDRSEFLEIEFLDRFSEKLVFRRQELMDATEGILADNGIRKPYSDDLEAVWEKR